MCCTLVLRTTVPKHVDMAASTHIAFSPGSPITLVYEYSPVYHSVHSAVRRAHCRHVRGYLQKISEREQALHESLADEAAFPAQLDALLHALHPSGGSQEGHDGTLSTGSTARSA